MKVLRKGDLCSVEESFLEDDISFVSKISPEKDILLQLILWI